MSLSDLKIRIKKNEGFSKKPYKDQLGFYTIGYGHLIKKNESNYLNFKYEKKHFEDLFERDFEKALKKYQQLFYKTYNKKSEKELLVEMIFQLGPNGVLKFKKMLSYLKNKKKYMACLEMMRSLWYKQTPKRVIDLINNFKKS